jgi:hypothetical protein
MASREASVDAVGAMRETTITVHVRRVRELRLRVWLAVRLIALAAWVANSNFRIARELEEGESTDGDTGDTGEY